MVRMSIWLELSWKKYRNVLLLEHTSNLERKKKRYKSWEFRKHYSGHTDSSNESMVTYYVSNEKQGDKEKLHFNVLSLEERYKSVFEIYPPYFQPPLKWGKLEKLGDIFLFFKIRWVFSSSASMTFTKMIQGWSGFKMIYDVWYQCYTLCFLQPKHQLSIGNIYHSGIMLEMCARWSRVTLPLSHVDMYSKYQISVRIFVYFIFP